MTAGQLAIQFVFLVCAGIALGVSTVEVRSAWPQLVAKIMSGIGILGFFELMVFFEAKDRLW